MKLTDSLFSFPRYDRALFSHRLDKYRQPTATGLLSLVLSGLLFTNVGFALDLQWSGSGDTGVDPLGHAWIIKNTTEAKGWGLPGIDEETLPWNASSSINGFSITFSGLPVGTVIDDTDTDPEATAFEVDSKAWTRTVEELTVSFTAPLLFDDRLKPGESFFVNVSFLGPFVPENISFEAEYTMITPEPTSLTLTLILGFTRLWRRRRSAEATFRTGSGNCDQSGGTSTPNSRNDSRV